MTIDKLCHIEAAHGIAEPVAYRNQVLLWSFGFGHCNCRDVEARIGRLGRCGNRRSVTGAGATSLGLLFSNVEVRKRENSRLGTPSPYSTPACRHTVEYRIEISIKRAFIVPRLPPHIVCSASQSCPTNGGACDLNHAEMPSNVKFNRPSASKSKPA